MVAIVSICVIKKIVKKSFFLYSRHTLVSCFESESQQVTNDNGVCRCTSVQNSQYDIGSKNVLGRKMFNLHWVTTRKKLD